MPLDELITYATSLEELVEAGADENELREQIYPVAFAHQVLLFTVRRLVQAKRMTPQQAAEIFGPGPSSETGPLVFLASRPRLCDIGGGPGAAEVEKCLAEGFVSCYVLDLLARGCESELRQVASIVLNVLDGWAGQLKQNLDSWAKDLSDVARALMCVGDDRFAMIRIEALSRVQNATRGVAKKVSEALDKKPWASKLQLIWSVGVSEINLRPKLEQLLASLPSRPEAWEEAADALPELRTSMQRGATDALESTMWRVLSEQLDSFEAQGADSDAAVDVAQALTLLARLRVGRGLASPEKPSTDSLNAIEAALTARVTNADIAGRRTTLLQVAAKLELDSEADPDDVDAMRSAIEEVRKAAEECRGMRLGEEELRPAFGRLSDFAEATAATGSLDVGADVVLSAMDCALALAAVMEPEDPAAEDLPAMGAVTRRLTQLVATLQVSTATDEFNGLGRDFETRCAADSNRVLRRVLDALNRLDLIGLAAGDKELPCVDGARAIELSYWEAGQKAALAELAAKQAKLLLLNKRNWKFELPDQIEWDDLVAAGGAFLNSFDAGVMLDATRPLKKAGPSARKLAATAET